MMEESFIKIVKNKIQIKFSLRKDNLMVLKKKKDGNFLHML